MNYLNLLLLAVILTVSTSCNSQKQEQEKKPNVIYILADDLGYGDLSMNGQEIIKTPNIDQLSTEGVHFTNHHSGSTVCAPSRSCLLTGQHTGHVRVRGNGKFEMAPGTLTVGHIMQEAGYHTAMIGKSGTGCQCAPGSVNGFGFDYFFGYLSHGKAHTYFPKSIYRNSEEIKFEGNGVDDFYSGDTYIHDIFIDEITNYITEHKDEPFFLHYSALLPHAQLYAPDRWKEPYKGLFDEVPYVKGAGYSPCEDPKATFAGMVSRLDWEVGVINKKLKELGIDDNTIVIFASDNGPHSAGGHNAKRFNSNGDLKGEKRDLYEGGVNVPFIVKWPNHIKPNTQTDHMSAFWDFLPTMCELTGVETPANTDGISFLPTLLAKDKDQKKHTHLYWEFHERKGKIAVLRNDGWKAIRLDAKTAKLPLELYNLNNDPAEENNVADQHPEIVKEMEILLKESRTEAEFEQFNLYEE